MDLILSDYPQIFPGRFHNRSLWIDDLPGTTLARVYFQKKITRCSRSPGQIQTRSLWIDVPPGATLARVYFQKKITCSSRSPGQIPTLVWGWTYINDLPLVGAPNLEVIALLGHFTWFSLRFIFFVCLLCHAVCANVVADTLPTWAKVQNVGEAQERQLQNFFYPWGYWR